MSRSGWVAAIAFGLATALSVGLASQAVAQEVGQAENGSGVELGAQQQAGDEDRTASGFVLPVRVVEDPDETERTKRRKDDADRREEGDLAAQTTMAEATLELVEVSWWQTKLALGGTILVFFSLVLSTIAVFAAVDANKQAASLFALEHRPRLKIISADRDDFTNDDGREGSLLRIKLKNIGGGTAKDVAIDAQHIAPKFPPIGNKSVIEFATRIKAGVWGGDHIVFAKDCDDLTPDNPKIDETSGYALVCVAYRCEITGDSTFRTACTICLNEGGGYIKPGSMYVT